MTTNSKMIHLSSANENAFYTAYRAAMSLQPVEFGELLKLMAQSQREGLQQHMKEQPDRDQIDSDITTTILDITHRLEALGNHIVSTDRELHARPGFILTEEEVTTD